MEDSEKDKIKKELVEWINQTDDSEALALVKEVQETYLKAKPYTQQELAYIESMLETSHQEIKEGNVIGLEELNELFDKWRSEAS